MLLRIAIVGLLVVGFAAGFAKLVDSDSVGRGSLNAPCEEWSNPECNGSPLAPAPGVDQ